MSIRNFVRIGDPDFKGNRCVFGSRFHRCWYFSLLRSGWYVDTFYANENCIHTWRVYVHILKKKKRRSENTRRTKGSRLIWKIKKELAPTDSPNYRISRRNIVGENCKRGRCTSWHDASSAIILTFPDDISTEYFNIHANPVFQIEGKIRPLKSREKYELFVTFKKLEPSERCIVSYHDYQTAYVYAFVESKFK